MFLDIIHHPVFIWKNRPVYFSKHKVSETGFCLRLWVKPTHLSPINRASPYFRTIGSGFYLKTETESSLQNVVFWKINRTVSLDKDRTMDNVQKHNICNKSFTLLPVTSLTGFSQLIHIGSKNSELWMSYIMPIIGKEVGQDTCYSMHWILCRQVVPQSGTTKWLVMWYAIHDPCSQWIVQYIFFAKSNGKRYWECFMP
jgi:hypothetical protein